MNDYNLKDHYLEVKEWYDGYHFGNIDIYCPWDVIQYCKSLYLDVSAKPQDFWSNSSGNAIVRRFIDKADISTRNEIERLIAGRVLQRMLYQNSLMMRLIKALKIYGVCFLRQDI